MKKLNFSTFFLLYIKQVIVYIKTKHFHSLKYPHLILTHFRFFLFLWKWLEAILSISEVMVYYCKAPTPSCMYYIYYNLRNHSLRFIDLCVRGVIFMMLLSRWGLAYNRPLGLIWGERWSTVHTLQRGFAWSV